MMRAMLDTARHQAAPANFMQRAGLLEALFQHYPAMPVGEGLKQFLKDWHEDVGHLPAHVLAEACRSYRRSKAQYRPTPGMLLDHVDKNWRSPLDYLERALSMLDTVDKGVDNRS